MCKNDFEIELDISVKTKGLVVFRGRMDFLGKLQDINALLDFIKDRFRDSPRLKKQFLINQLVCMCGIPKGDACHFVEKLQEEGYMYEPETGKEELVFIG